MYPPRTLHSDTHTIKTHITASSTPFSLFSLQHISPGPLSALTSTMDFHKQETTSSATSRRMMMMMMRDKTTKTTTNKSTLNFNDEHEDQDSGDNMGGDDEDDISLARTVNTTEDKKQKRLSTCSSNTTGRRVAACGGGGGGSGIVSCQAEKCMADLTDAKRYHRRHKVCEVHAKAPSVLVSGLHQRFCQQCSRFHELPEFDDTKRSCRRRLAGHNERRRKSSSESQAEGGSSNQTKGSNSQFRLGDDHERANRTTQISSFSSGNGTSTYKQFQLR